MRRRVSRLRWTTLLSGLLVAAGCGDDGGTGTTGAGTDTATTATGTATTGSSTGTGTTGTGTTAGTVSGSGGSSGSTGGSTGATTGGTGTTGSGSTGGSASGGTTGTGGTAGTSGTGGSTGGSGTTGGVATDIEVVITADNAYGFGYGTDSMIFNYWGGVENFTAGEIFNCGDGPETYLVPGSEADNATHLYIIAWADSAVTQGVIGRFHRTGDGMFGEDVFTGDGNWEVCATGMNFSPGSGGPSQTLIDQMIVACNEGNLDPNTSSGGWVDAVGTSLGALAVGEDNTTPYNGGPQPGNEFPLVCQNLMPAEARWMWFNWDPANIVWPNQSPFLWPGGGGNPDHQFLIFRLAADVLPPPQ